MEASALTVHGNWHRASSSADVDPEAQTITGVHAPFVFPIAPEPARTAVASIRTVHAAATADAIDDFFGVTRPRATRESQHDVHPSLGGDIPPPPYADADLPAYSADSNTEPTTLAMYLFKFGFLFPPFWVLGTIILMSSPPTVPVDFEPAKLGIERQQLVQVIRDVELRWAKRCAWALVALLMLAGIFAAFTFTVMYP